MQQAEAGPEDIRRADQPLSLTGVRTFTDCVQLIDKISGHMMLFA